MNYKNQANVNRKKKIVIKIQRKGEKRQEWVKDLMIYVWKTLAGKKIFSDMYRLSDKLSF